MSEITKGVADTLNLAGDALAEQLADSMSSELGVPAGVMRGLIYVTRASKDRLAYRINSLPAFGEAPPRWQPGARTWRDVSRPIGTFKHGELVWIVNPHEDRCEICDDIIKQKLVYTIEEVQAMGGREGGDLTGQTGVRTDLLHPNCRCYPAPARTINRLPGKFTSAVPRLREVEEETVKEFMERLSETPMIALKRISGWT